MEPARLPTIEELRAAVASRTGEESAGARLRLAIELGRELSELGDALIGRFVAEARDAGLSWNEIGKEFGISKQAAQQRYGTVLVHPVVSPETWGPTARLAIDRAVDEAGRLGHDYVGTEHALLALASVEQGLAAEVLSGLGVRPERILATSCMRPGTAPAQASACLPFMPRLKEALENSRRIADALEAPVADTEHLLAGIVAVPGAMAVEILRRLKVSPDTVRAALADRLAVDPDRLATQRRRRRRLLGAVR